LLAAVCNVPLFLALGYVDEVRALSMLDVSAALLLCATASAWLAGTGERRRSASVTTQDSPAVTGGALPAGAAAAVNDT